MLYLVRGKTSSKEQVLMIEADSPEAAEATGWKRGLFVTSVTEKATYTLTPDWMEPALKKLWRYAPAGALRCLGRPVSPTQTAALLALGVVTGALNLHAAEWF